MSDPIISVTSEVEVDACFAAAKSRGESFFIYYSYAVTRALNEIESFRLRAVSEPIGSPAEVYLYDVVDMVSPIKISESGKYVEIHVPYTPNFEEFYRNAFEAIAAAPSLAGNDDIFLRMDQSNTYVCVSAMPKLHFTSVKHARTSHGGVNMLTLLSVGKMIPRDGRHVMPIAISVHHGLTDGGHIEAFFVRVQEILNSL